MKFINPPNKTVVEIDGEAIPVIYRRQCAEQNGNSDKLSGRAGRCHARIQINRSGEAAGDEAQRMVSRLNSEQDYSTV